LRPLGETAHQPPAIRDPASFRDPDAAVFHGDSTVYRALTGRGAANWQTLRTTRFFTELSAAGKIIATEELGESDTRPGGLDAASVLRHELVPFTSYPYEWPFGMLRDAALLQLEVLRASVAEGLALKDGSAYNVQWKGAAPVFIDIGSFEPLDETRPWDGYRQFCMQFLYPLFLTAYKGVDFQPLLRGRLEGVSPQQCRSLLSLRDLARRGVLGHVWLHSRLERHHANRADPVAQQVAQAGFNRDLMLANVKRLQRIVSRLDWKPRHSAWSDYASDTSYAESDRATKVAFVQEILESRAWTRVWDLGCNDGRFSRLAAQSAQYVLAIDSDHAVVERFYRELKEEDAAAILPLVVDVADPSPGLGWRGSERRELACRGRPDLVMCLALVHHLALTCNVPLGELVEWLWELRGSLVIEFVSPDDPKARQLLARKRPGVQLTYDRESFETELAKRFSIIRRQELATGLRTLYFAAPHT
jgi:SAM-dependent methyltransferase